LVLRGHRATLFENRTQGPPDERVSCLKTASQTAGPYVHIGLVLRGHRATLFENRTQGPPDERVSCLKTASQTA
ncbi:hypothetical protein CK204_27490, partial [Klebsiella pneumoniae]